MSEARYRERLGGVTLALLVQAGLITLLVMSFYRQVPSRHDLAHELIWLLRALPKTPAPRTIDARREKPALAAPDIFGSAPPAFALPSLAPPPMPGALQGLNDALFGCAPEIYGLLSPEQRLHCPPPGVMPPHDDSDLLTPPPSHALDEAFWQEQWRRDHFTYGLCTGGSVVNCLVEQSREERRREQEADRHIQADRDRAMRGVGPNARVLGLPSR